MSIDFTPSQNSYKDLGAFKFWCQKVLPMVYDDSLSYYEVLGKLTNYLNEVIDNLNKMGEDTTKLYQAYTELQNYVNRYFDNLDVQNEINNKLNSMAFDGTLNDLLMPYAKELEDIVSAYENSTNANLAQLNNKVSIMESRMDGFTQLEGGSTTGDAELADGRIGFRGSVYQNIGDNIRTNDTFNHDSSVNIGNSIAPKRFVPKYQLITNEVLNVSGNPVTAEGYQRTTPILVLPGQSIKFMGKMNSSNAIGCVFNVNGAFLELLAYGSNDDIPRGFIYTNTTGVNVYVVCCCKQDDYLLGIVNTHIYRDVKDIVFNNKFIRNDGSETRTEYYESFDKNTSYTLSSVFELKCGESIMLTGTVSQSIPAVIKTDMDGKTFEDVVTGAGGVTSYIYTAKDSVEYLRVQLLKDSASTLGLVSKSNSYNTNTKNDTRKGVVTFIVDDGRTGDIDFYNEFVKRGLKCGFALLTTMATSNDCKQYLEWYYNGFDVLAHSTDGDVMNDPSESVNTIKNKLKESLRILSARGFNIRGWVTPSSEMATTFRPLVNDYYTYGYTIYKGNYVPNDNDRPYNNFTDNMNELWRVHLVNPLDTLMYCVNKTIENHGFLTFYVHAGDLNENGMADFKTLLDYIVDKTNDNSLKCLAPNEAIQYYFTSRKTDI